MWRRVSETGPVRTHCAHCASPEDTKTGSSKGPRCQALVFSYSALELCKTCLVSLFLKGRLPWHLSAGPRNCGAADGLAVGLDCLQGLFHPNASDPTPAPRAPFWTPHSIALPVPPASFPAPCQALYTMHRRSSPQHRTHGRDRLSLGRPRAL